MLRPVAAIIVLCVAVGVASAARAVELVTPAGKKPPGSWQSWADSALVPTVKGRVTIRRSGCPGLPRAAGCVYTKRPRVIYLKRGLEHPRGVLLHRLGHVYDLTVLSNKDRGRFRKIMRQSTKWWTGKRPLAEWFAEGYSWCARYTRIASISKYALYRYRPSAAQHRQVCALIKRAARDRTPPAAPPQAPPVVTGDPAPTAPPPVSTGVVPGDPALDPGPGPPESPTATPTPSPTPTRTPVPTIVPPLPIPTIVPTVRGLA